MDGQAGAGRLGQVIRQVTEATFSQLVLPLPAVILVETGEKLVEGGGRSILARPGQAILLPEGLPLAVTNRPPGDSPYRARVLPFAREAVESACARLGARLVRPAPGPVLAPTPGPGFRARFEGLFHETEILPEPILAVRVEEMLLWLAEDGAVMGHAIAPTVASRLRMLLASDPSRNWSAGDAARALGFSAPTLRRRLAAEGARFSDMLADVRMSRALGLLQTGAWQVGVVAAEVGYDSPSRFAARFRARFGLTPHQVRAKAG